MPKLRHAHPSREIFNSNVDAHTNLAPFSSPHELKSAFQKAMAFCTKRDERSYAQVLSTQWDRTLHKPRHHTVDKTIDHIENSITPVIFEKHAFHGRKCSVLKDSKQRHLYSSSPSDLAVAVNMEVNQNHQSVCVSQVYPSFFQNNSSDVPSNPSGTASKSDNRKQVNNHGGITLSNRFEVLKDSSDDHSDIQPLPEDVDPLVTTYNMHRHSGSDDRKTAIPPFDKKPFSDQKFNTTNAIQVHAPPIATKCLHKVSSPDNGEKVKKIVCNPDHPTVTDGQISFQMELGTLPHKSQNDRVELKQAPSTAPPHYKMENDSLLPIWCTEFQQCRQQIGLRFGCVPLSPIVTYNGPDIYWDEIPDVLTAHTIIRDSGQANFLGKRIPVHTNLKVHNWRKYLVNYFDQQLPDLIAFGFPLSFDRNLNLVSENRNHPSAVQFIDHVDSYIKEELSYKAIIGPFDNQPFKMHVSPFMTREKAGSDTRRTIIDMSWPKGASVNDGVLKDSYLGTTFQMHYPSVDTIIQQVISTGPAAKIFKVDISRAFRQIRIDPGDIDLLGLTHRDQWYLDLSLPFGFRLGAFFFQKLSDAIRYIMQQQGFPYLQNYIDDLIYIGLPSSVDQAYHTLLHLLQELGLEISIKKLNPPDTKVVCLGILIDTIQRTMAIPADKLQQIMSVCEDWSDKRVCTKNQLQSLLGLLLYVSKCVKPARYFLNRMLQLLRDNFDKNKIKVTTDFTRDLNWFKTFLASYNGVTFYDIRPLNDHIYLDACLTGLGAAFNDMVYFIPIPRGYMQYNIAHLEMLNVVVALKVWGQCWANKRIKIHCDNKAVVDILAYGRARDHTMATCARNIWLLTAMYNITLLVVHIEGRSNTVADLLSRWSYTDENVQDLHKFITHPIWMNTHIDLTLLNYKL